MLYLVDMLRLANIIEILIVLNLCVSLADTSYVFILYTNSSLSRNYKNPNFIYTLPVVFLNLRTLPIALSVFYICANVRINSPQLFNIAPLNFKLQSLAAPSKASLILRSILLPSCSKENLLRTEDGVRPRVRSIFRVLGRAYLLATSDRINVRIKGGSD